MTAAPTPRFRTVLPVCRGDCRSDLKMIFAPTSVAPIPMTHRRRETSPSMLIPAGVVAVQAARNASNWVMTGSWTSEEGPTRADGRPPDPDDPRGEGDEPVHVDPGGGGGGAGGAQRLELVHDWLLDGRGGADARARTRGGRPRPERVGRGGRDRRRGLHTSGEQVAVVSGLGDRRREVPAGTASSPRGYGPAWRHLFSPS